MCKGQGRGNPEIQSKEDQTTNGCRVEGRDFKKIKELD